MASAMPSPAAAEILRGHRRVGFLQQSEIRVEGLLSGHNGLGLLVRVGELLSLLDEIRHCWTSTSWCAAKASASQAIVSCHCVS